MKKINLILILLVSVLSSCNDDFLERAPIVSISDAKYWKTPEDLKLYVNNFYNNNDLLSQYKGSSIGPFGLDADNGTDTQVSYNYNKRMNGENTLPASGGGWSTSDWGTLRTINYFLDNYSRVEETAEVKNYVGEVLFFRSIFYFNKLRSFGAVPWISSTLDNKSPLLYEGRLPRNQVVDSIMEDLDKAVEYLPERKSYSGRITKEVALLLQARIALYEGTWEKHHARKGSVFKVNGQDGSKFITKAAQVTDKLILLSEEKGNIGLTDCRGEWGYTDLFNQRDLAQNKEVLLWRKYSEEDGQYTNWGESYAAGRGLSKSLVDSYLCLDGKPISVSTLYQGDQTLQDVVSNRDPRLNQTIYVNDGKHIRFDDREIFERPRFEGNVSQTCPTGYELYKGRNTNYNECINWQSTIAAIYFRYAEALLINAEAKAELGTITQEDVNKTINALRKRVGMPESAMLDINNIADDPNWEFGGISPILNEIRRERKVELACEGFRMDDIFRWAAVDEIIVSKRPKGAVKSQWADFPGATDAFKEAWTFLDEDKNGYIDPYGGFPAMADGYKFNLERDYLSPIPTNELVLNPALGQNPGW